MSSILYISYTGLLDPLGQSQVLQYVRQLAQDHQITVLSFEKPDSLRDQESVAALGRICEDAGISWKRLVYHKRPGIPATLYDIAAGVRAAARLVRDKEASCVHTRSYVAGAIGLLVKRRSGARFIFDMRGFWPDERVDGEIWKRESMRYRVFKWIERRLFLGADHVVSLTHAGKREIEAFDYLQGRMPPISVIPTCTNLDMFMPVTRPSSEQPSLTLGYVGSAGSWYLFEEVAKTVYMLFNMCPDARFLVINKGDHEVIRTKLRDAGVDLKRVEIISVPFTEVGKHVARMDAGIFFYRPTWSKTATSPTRLGEFLACGKPVLANTGVGDVEKVLRETDTGIAIETFDEDALHDGLIRLMKLAEEPDIANRCRRAAEQRFSLEHGVAEYGRIYSRLAGEDPSIPVGAPV